MKKQLLAALAAAALAVSFFAAPLAAQVGPVQATYTITATGFTPWLPLSGQTTCYIVTSGTATYTIIPQVTSDSAASIAAGTAAAGTATAINSGSIAANGSYGGQIAANGIAAIRLDTTAIVGTEVATITCNSANANLAGASFPTPLAVTNNGGAFPTPLALQPVSIASAIPVQPVPLASAPVFSSIIGGTQTNVSATPAPLIQLTSGTIAGLSLSFATTSGIGLAEVALSASATCATIAQKLAFVAAGTGGATSTIFPAFNSLTSFTATNQYICLFLTGTTPQGAITLYLQ